MLLYWVGKLGIEFCKVRIYRKLKFAGLALYLECIFLENVGLGGFLVTGGGF